MVVAAAAAGAFFLVGDGEPTIGDCVRSVADGSFETVDCDSSEAMYTIVGKESGESTYEDFLADQASCSEFPDAVAAGWYGSEGEEGTVFCAGPI